MSGAPKPKIISGDVGQGRALPISALVARAVVRDQY